MKELIGYADFQKLELRTGRIKSAERVAGTDKLMRIIVDIGSGERQLVAGIAERNQCKYLIAMDSKIGPRDTRVTVLTEKQI